MENIVLGVIIHDGKVAVEELAVNVRAKYRGLPAVMPGGRVQEGEDPRRAVRRKIRADIGVDVHVEDTIAFREHPLFPGGSISYYFCSLIGTDVFKNHTPDKIKSVKWVDIATAVVMMLTLYTQVLSFMIQKIYGSSLPEGSKLPELEWLSQDIAEFGKRIRQGELVAFPTETVYGIGANAFDEVALQSIFTVKNRPADNPLIVHVPNIEAVEQLSSVLDSLTVKLLEQFTPGPLTILLPKNESLPSIVTAGSAYVGIRIPSHNFALELISAAKVPIAAPSANKSGKPSATHHNHVIEAFGDELPNVLRGGETNFGLESTVVMPKGGEQLVIMRQGAISQESLQEAFPSIEVVIAKKEDHKNVPTPGSKYRHYAPVAEITMVPNLSREKEIELFKTLYLSARKKGEVVVVLCSEELQKKLPKTYSVITLGSEKELGTIGRNLYSALLECDSRRITKILTQSFPEEGVGRTVMERIRRAAEVK